MMRVFIPLYFIFIFVVAIAANGASGQSILHVDASAPSGGDGTSWLTAFSDLQDALDAARSNPIVEEIWVAGGMYFPDRGTADRAATFAMVERVGVYGGFLGDELTRTSRALRRAETVLSGDIGIPSDPSDNSKAVVSVSPDTAYCEIENVTIVDGYGTWGSGLDVHARALAVRIEGCRFQRNNSVWGGALLIDASQDCTVIDCDFDSNTAGHGGAIYLANILSSTEIVNCRFFNNSAGGFGGAVANSSSHPIFRNCTFINNRADREGGALSNSGGDAQFVNCIMWKNAPTPIRDQESITTISYSCITGGWPGEGNFSADPGLIDLSSGDLRLAPNSPCIDAGDNSGVPPEQTLDLDFNPRFIDDPGTPDAGRGTAPIVDLGCYEFQDTSFAVLDPTPGQAGRVNRLTAIGAAPGATIWFIHGLRDGETPVPGCPGATVNIDAPKIIGSAVADEQGVATIDRFVPHAARGVEVLLQSVDQQGCRVTRVVRAMFD